VSNIVCIHSIVESLRTNLPVAVAVSPGEFAQVIRHMVKRYGINVHNHVLARLKKMNDIGATENARPDIARLDNAAPYRKGGHRETCFSVLVDSHYKFMFDSAARRFYVCSSISFCFTYYVRQTKLASSLVTLVNVLAHYKIVNDCVID